MQLRKAHRGYCCAVLIIALVLSAAYSACAAEPGYIFGIHDVGGAGIIEQAGKRGWIVVTVQIGSNPYNFTGDNFTAYSNAGHGVIVRLNNGYGSAGTLPYQSQYANFATRCANYVAATTGADIFIIGNETNLPREWPGNIEGVATTGEPITVARYVDCYNRCYNAIKEVRPTAQVCPSPAGTWAPPYPGQGIEGFMDYWVNILNAIGPNKIDALILHAYTHGCDPALVTSESKMGPPYQDIYYNFRVYKNYMWAIPASMRTKPVYITECDQNIECADGPPKPRHTWYNVNNGWVKAIYKEINDWNNVISNQKIRCVALFRWDDVPEGEWSFGISNRQNVIADWREAMQNNYRWDTYLKGTIAGTVKDNANTPIVGAKVTTSPGGYTALTNSNGAYSITGVPVGTYDVSATKTGYASQTHTGRTVTGNTTTYVSFALTPAPPLKITSVTSIDDLVEPGQTSIPVSITLQSAALEDLQVEEAYPTFRLDAQDVSDFYIVTPSPSNGTQLSPGGTLTLNYTVSVKPDAPRGPTVVDAYAKAWPNAIINPSFEQGGPTPPPTHWWEWQNAPAPGAIWEFDTTTKTSGTRSYKLRLDNAVNGLLCTINTGSAGDLLPVLASTQYYNAVKKKTSVTAGAPTFMLVFAQYDSNGTQIGADAWSYFSASTDWQEHGTYYTTAPNAAFARVWLGLKAGGTTTASLWVDDVQLRPVGVYYTDSAADTNSTWMVVQLVDSIAQAKQYEDMLTVKLTDRIVSAKFANYYYIQDDDRASGVRVEGTTTAPVGGRVSITGFLMFDGVERVLYPMSTTESP